jgi:hypothetical protein
MTIFQHPSHGSLGAPFRRTLAIPFQRFARLAVLLATVVGILWPGSLLGEIPRFAFTGLPATITNETAFSATIEARDIAGGRRTDISGRHRLAAYSRPWAGLIITEIADNCRRIEVMNGGVEPMDVGGYSLVFEYLFRNFDTFLPPGRIVGPGEVFVMLSPELGTDDWPSIHAYGIPHLVKLKDRSGQTLDEIRIPGASVASELWTGFPIQHPDALSSQRIGSELKWSAQEWQTAPRTLGQVNPMLAVPRSGWRSAARITPEFIVFTNGLWSGEIFVGAPAGVVTLAVDDGGGRLSESSTINLVPLPRLSLTVDTMATVASEAAAGAFATLKITRPGRIDSAAVIRLRSDYPAEITAPETITIPAGEVSASFAITNFDDNIADGRALVTITASASGFNEATLELTNEDDEQVHTTLIMPSVVNEDTGWTLTPGWVHLAEPAQHPVEVRLSTTNGVLQLPSRVMIPAGKQAAPFSFVVGSDSITNQSPVVVLVAASVAAGEPASTVVRIVDSIFPLGTGAYAGLVNPRNTGLHGNLLTGSSATVHMEPAPSFSAGTIGASLTPSYFAPFAALQTDEKAPTLTREANVIGERSPIEGLATAIPGVGISSLAAAVGGAADLQLIGRLETEPGYGLPVVWSLTVTNIGETMAEQVYVSVTYIPDNFQDAGLDRPFSYVYDNNRFSLASHDIGPIPAGGSKTLKVTGVMVSHLRLEARATTLGSDPSPGDNLALVSADIRPAKLALTRVQGPRATASGSLAEYQLIVTNLDTERFVGRLDIIIEGHHPLGLVSGSLEKASESGLNKILQRPISIEAGDFATINTTIRADIPGVYDLKFTLLAFGDQFGDDNSGSLTLAVSASNQSGLTIPVNVEGQLFEWVPALQRLAIGNPTTIRLVNPVSFEPADVPIPGGLERFKICADGRHAWVLDRSFTLYRIHLETGATEPPMASGDLMSFGDFAPDSEDPDLLFVLHRAEGDRLEAVAVKGGLDFQGPVTIPWDPSRRPRLVAGSAGTCYALSFPEIYELELKSDGFRLARQWSAPEVDGEVVAADRDQLLFANGRVFRPGSGQTVTNLGVLGYDREAGSIFSLREQNLDGFGPAGLGLLSSGYALEWNIPLSRLGISNTPRIVPMGTNGVLFPGFRSIVVKPGLWSGMPVEFAMSVISHIEPRPDVGILKNIEIAVTNLGNHVSQNPRIEVQLSEGVESGETPGLRSFSVPFTLGFGIAQLTIPVRFIGTGSQEIVLRLTNDLPAIAREDHVVRLAFDAEEAPSVVLLDAVLGQDDPLVFGISRPSETMVNAYYQVMMVSANGQTTNFRGGTLTFDWSRTATLAFPIPNVPFQESGGRATIRLRGGDIANVGTEFQAEIVASQRLLTTTSLGMPEGDEGFSEAVLPVTLSDAAGIPVEVSYEALISGTTTNLVSGRLRFQPGQTTNYVSIPVAGNRVFDGNRLISIRLFQPWNAALSRGGTGGGVGIIEDDPVPQPRISLVSGDDRTLRLRFIPDPHVYYRIQYTTNVTATQWIDLMSSYYPLAPVDLPLQSDDTMRLYRILAE